MEGARASCGAAYARCRRRPRCRALAETLFCGPDIHCCAPGKSFWSPKNLFCGADFLFCGPEKTGCAADFTRTWHGIGRCGPEFPRRALEFLRCGPEFPFYAFEFLRNKLNFSHLRDFHLKHASLVSELQLPATPLAP
jgi:hypothetical protein